MTVKTKIALSSILLFIGLNSQQIDAQDAPSYKQVPAEIAQLLNAPTTPAISISPNKEWILLLERSDLPSIEQLSRPELRLGGLRLDPQNFGPSRSSYFIGLKLKRIKDGAEFEIKGLPKPLLLAANSWSPDSKKIAFTQNEADEISLWVIDLSTLVAKRMSKRKINATLGNTYSWLSDSKRILFSAIPEDIALPPIRPKTPKGPVIEENLGKKAPSRTFQDLLKNSYDEALFSYYATADLVLIDPDEKESTVIQGVILNDFNPSPDASYVLTSIIKPPFSYLAPYNRFPQDVSVYDLSGSLVKRLVEIPLTDYVSSAFNAVEKTPRNHAWRADKAACVYWVEALDGGDPKTAATHRDRLMELAAPFKAEARELIRTKLRFSSVLWGNEEMALVTARWWNNRMEETWWLNPSKPESSKLLRERNYEDNYNNPGQPALQNNLWGRPVLAIQKNMLFLTGQGSSDKGDMPFLDQYNLITGKTKRLWQCKAPYYEYVVTITDLQGGSFITSRESKEDNPNYFMRMNWGSQLKPITKFPNPYPALKLARKEQLRYKRKDGVELTATLILPPNYDTTKGPLPTLVWAYPREFKSQQTASQVTGSPYTFTRISSGSPIFWVMRGYAVIDNASMPIVGEGDNEPNDTYVKQLVENAQAIFDYATSLGVTDPNRVAVGGHSYGAFMTANLLAHTNLFKAGIARSGAYNRTLTPFGFQSEERTYWQAPEVYHQMSPFSYADKIKTPLLLIHGEADNNPGTFPIQSERLYNAIKGHGGTIRYVVLPHESHGYRARESVEHMLWEMDTWLETYVKKTP